MASPAHTCPGESNPRQWQPSSAPLSPAVSDSGPASGLVSAPTGSRRAPRCWQCASRWNKSRGVPAAGQDGPRAATDTPGRPALRFVHDMGRTGSSRLRAVILRDCRKVEDMRQPRASLGTARTIPGSTSTSNRLMPWWWVSNGACGFHLSACNSHESRSDPPPAPNPPEIKGVQNKATQYKMLKLRSGDVIPGRYAWGKTPHTSSVPGSST